MKAGRSGCSTRTASSTRSSRPRTSAPAISASRFDAIVFASQGVGAGGGRGGRGGGGGGGGPAADAANAAADSAAADEIRAVDEFVKRRRNASSRGIRARRRSSTRCACRCATSSPVLTAREYFTGGSIMQVVDRPDASGDGGHAGARRRLRVQQSGVHDARRLRGRGAREVSRPMRRRCAPGFLSGPQYMQGFAAALDVKHDAGHVVLFAFQPQWRGQPTGTFRTVFNAAFFARDVADQAQAQHAGFWTAPPLPATPATHAARPRRWPRQSEPPLLAITHLDVECIVIRVRRPAQITAASSTDLARVAQLDRALASGAKVAGSNPAVRASDTERKARRFGAGLFARDGRQRAWSDPCSARLVDLPVPMARTSPVA